MSLPETPVTAKAVVRSSAREAGSFGTKFLNIGSNRDDLPVTAGKGGGDGDKRQETGSQGKAVASNAGHG
ncbi:hypothetical protein [Labrys sp. KNU-23]|uniref:hypothetical protein n=1 Tax=Labrys sp. KNU-23 TaxID=2789216 RepID=UPI00165A7D2F|nr:hypothetical protein [Labrys sp. KNU-23]